jgi:hypothetical protein
VNEGFCKELGLKREKILGNTDHDLFPRALADKYNTGWRGHNAQANRPNFG